MAKKQDPQIEWGFHAVIPRLVRTGYEKLTPVQKWLYVCLKDLCGEHGTCYRALRVLAEETGISIGMLSESIRCLHDAGLIHAEKKRRSLNPTAKEVWHITIVDIWQANAKTHPTKRSQNEHYKEGNVHTVNNNVHVANDNGQERSPAEQQCSHSETEEVSISSINIEAVSQSSNVVATSSEDRNAPAPINFVERKSDKYKAITKEEIASHSQRLSEEDDPEATKPRTEAVKPSQHTPGAGVPLSLAVNPPVDRQDESTSVQALPVSPSRDAAQRTILPQAGVGAASQDGAVQASCQRTRKVTKVTQADDDVPAPQPKCDTREIQRRINEHRGYQLEEKVDIIRERQAIKTWCSLHTLEEYGLVMAGAKNDKYWGKAENYYRIGGLTLLKITPEILARQRQPLHLVSNGYNGHSNGNQDGLVYQGDLVLWNGKWMTEEEADKTGYNGGFGLYK